MYFNVKLQEISYKYNVLYVIILYFYFTGNKYVKLQKVFDFNCKNIIMWLYQKKCFENIDESVTLSDAPRSLALYIGLPSFKC